MLKAERALEGYFIVAIKRETLQNSSVSLEEIGSKVYDCFADRENSEEGDIIWINSY